MTGRDLVSTILRTMGVLASGEQPSGSEAADGLAAINRMLDSWSNERLLIYQTVLEEFPFVAGQSTYTLGTGGDFNTIRPQWIEEVTLRDNSPNPAVEFPMRLLSMAEYSQISVKDLRSTYPYSVFDNGGYPLRTLIFYPVPSAVHSAKIFSAKPLSNIATLDTVLTFPKGFERTLVFNGAVELGPEFGKVASADLQNIAMESKANLKRNFFEPDYLRVDEDIRAIPNRFNVYTGFSR